MNTQTSRGVAVTILQEILENGAYANIALRKALGESELDSRDRAFVTELVNETLRNLISIDQVLNHFSSLPIKEMKPFIRNLLRVSLCQIRHIEKTPESAAVNEAVNLAKHSGYAGLSGFVNGILRTIIRKPDEPPTPKHGSPDYLASRYSYPSWLAASLIKWLGAEEALHFCEVSHTPPPVTVFPNTIKITQADLVARLEEEGVMCTPLTNDFIMVRNMGDIAKLKTFQQGLFFVMDPGAMWAICALGLTPGQTVIDLCAAPGGKSFAAACAMNDTGLVRAFDVHPHRTGLVRETMKRMGITCVKPETKDAMNLDPKLLESADAVLLDAPCTGFGTIRKRPEIKYNRHPRDISDLAKKQREMLTIAAKYVKPGGKLVYSTCTVAREENIENIQWFLQKHPFTMRPAIIPDTRHIIEEDTLLLLPDTTNDCFFIAAMEKQ